MTFAEYQLKEHGYKVLTDYWDRFGQAEKDGPEGVEKAFADVLKDALGDAKKMAELALVLDHRCWGHFNADRHRLGRAYAELFNAVWDMAILELNGADLEYFLRITD